MIYDKDKIKNNLTEEQIIDFVGELGGEPQVIHGDLVCKTICHNGQHHKMYYYPNNHLFHCYSDCGCSFDIFELVKKVKSLELGEEISLYSSIKYVADYFNISPENETNPIFSVTDEDMKYLSKVQQSKEYEIEKHIVEFKEYSADFLNFLPQPAIEAWINEGISKESQHYFNIKYDPSKQVIVIPHYDIDNKLIGIRQRALIDEDVEKYGKYRPYYFNKKLFSHPLGMNLYGINWNKENIKRLKTAIVVESEKSVMQAQDILGENNIVVAVCGSSFTTQQAEILMKLGVQEIVIGLDRQFQDFNDKEHLKLIKNFLNIFKKFGNFIKISYMFDYEGLLPYKASPTDMGKEIFFELFNKREHIYEN